MAFFSPLKEPQGVILPTYNKRGDELVRSRGPVLIFLD